MRSIWEYNLFSNIYTPHQTSETFSWTNCIKTPGYDLSYIGSAGKYQDLQSATKDKTNTEQIHSPLLPHNFEFMLWIGYCFKNISRRNIILFSELSIFCTSWQTTSYEFSMAKFPRRKKSAYSISHKIGIIGLGKTRLQDENWRLNFNHCEKFPLI